MEEFSKPDDHQTRYPSSSAQECEQYSEDKGDRVSKKGVVNVSFVDVPSPSTQLDLINVVTSPWVSQKRLCRRPVANPPKSCLFFSIVMTIAVFPVGVFAIIFSIQSIRASAAGDYWRARSKARNAFIFNWTGLLVGIFIIILCVALLI